MKTRWFFLTFILLLLLSLTLPASAMQSASYKVDWLVPITGSGGNAASSFYSADFTLGQSVIGSESGVNTADCLGYWCGSGGEYYIMLPLITR